MLIAWRILAWYHVGVLLSVAWTFSQFLQCILNRKNEIFCTFPGYCICLISCQSNLLFLWHMGEWIGSFCLVVCQRLLSYLHVCMLLIVLIMSFLSYPFFCKFFWLVLNGWVLSRERWWKLYVQASWLQTVFVLGGGTTWHVGIYLCVDFLYTWWPKVPSVFLEIRTSRKRFLFSSMSTVSISMLIVEEK